MSSCIPVNELNSRQIANWVTPKVEILRPSKNTCIIIYRSIFSINMDEKKGVRFNCGRLDKLHDCMIMNL